MYILEDDEFDDADVYQHHTEIVQRTTEEREKNNNIDQALHWCDPYVPEEWYEMAQKFAISGERTIIGIYPKDIEQLH
jgi:NTP pyrophosphatase (non-canonical NTP hydrolase)